MATNEEVVSSITNYVAECIGDIESAENFVSNFDSVPINTVRDRYVVSPVYWIVMTLIPETFIAHSPAISIYLSSLIRDLSLTKANMESALAMAKADIAKERSDIEYETFLSRKAKGESDAVARIHVKRALSELEYREARVVAELKGRIDECSANITYATACMFAVKDFVSVARDIDTIRAASVDVEVIRSMLRTFMSHPDAAESARGEVAEGVDDTTGIADSGDPDDFDNAPSGSTKHSL